MPRGHRDTLPNIIGLKIERFYKVGAPSPLGLRASLKAVVKFGRQDNGGSQANLGG